MRVDCQNCGQFDAGAGQFPEMLRELRRAVPWLSIGNFARAKDERLRHYQHIIGHGHWKQ